MVIYNRLDMCRAIDSYVVNPRHREVLRLKFCEVMTYEQVGAITHYSTQHVKSICKNYKEMLISFL